MHVFYILATVSVNYSILYVQANKLLMDLELIQFLRYESHVSRGSKAHKSDRTISITSVASI
jgi:hypothetical protein